MLRALSLLLLLLATGVASATERVQVPLESLSLPQLEQHLTEIDSELAQLARFNLRGGAGSLGYHTRNHPEPEGKESIRIELGAEFAVDEVVLVPYLFRDSETGLRAGGFPIAFRILAGTAEATKVVAAFSGEDHLLLRWSCGSSSSRPHGSPSKSPACRKPLMSKTNTHCNSPKSWFSAAWRM